MPKMPQTMNVSLDSTFSTSLNQRILIVDDNFEIHSDFRKILLPSPEQKLDAEFDEMEALFNDDHHLREAHEKCVTIDSAHQGEEAIEKVNQSLKDGQPYSLAFIDVRMPPGIDGIETTRRILELDPEIQVVICTAYSDYSWHEIVRHLNSSNRFLILKKPFDNIEVRQIAFVLHSRWLENRTEALTGVLNRRAFAAHLTRQRKLAQESGNPLSCVMVDLDHFKRVNDIHGHLAGDRVLVEAARVLHNQCGSSDLICRYGGEEFCVLLKGKSEADACRWAEQARLRLSELNIAAADSKIGLTGSFGVASLNDAAMSDNGMFLEAADQAMFAAKKSGRNQVVGFSNISRKLDQANLDKPNALSPLNHGQAKDVIESISAVKSAESFEMAANLLLEGSAGRICCTPCQKMVCF